MATKVEPISGRVLRIADNLILPADAVTQKFAFLGRTGSGKTYGAMKLAEELLSIVAQIVAIDPVGVWYGLRLSADGKTPGFQIPVFGGLHGDFPLEPTGGALMADIIVDRGTSAVIDVSQMTSADHARFATAFAKRLFERKKAAPSPIHLFLEEAQEFIPQNPQANEAMMLHEFSRLGKIGRNFGIGLSPISQRPQEVNKKVLNMTECMFAFQMTGPHERKTIRDWVHEKGQDDDIVDKLPRLSVGEAHVWSPQWLQISETVKIGRKRTFNTSSTPTIGDAKRADIRPLNDSDLGEIRKQMAATIERAKADDPRELRKKIAELERAVAAKSTATPPADPQAIEKAREAGRQQAQREGQVAIKNLAKLYAPLVRFVRDIADKLPGLIPAEMEFNAVAAEESVPAHVSKSAIRETPQPINARLNSSSPRVHADGSIGKAERKILTVLAQFPEGCGKRKLTLLSGYAYSGGFRNSLSALRTKGFIVGDNKKTMNITEEGLQALGSFEPLPKGQALIDYWAQHPSLGKATRQAFLHLAGIYPRGLSGPDLATACGYEYSGGFRNALSELRTSGLAEGENGREITISAELF